MPALVDDLDQRLKQALGEDLARREGRVLALLDEIDRLDHWAQAGIPDDLKVWLAERRTERALALAAELIEVRRNGATLSLTSTHAVAPAAEPPPSDAPVRLVAPLPPPEAVVAPPPEPAPSAPKPPLPPASPVSLSELKSRLEAGGAFEDVAPPVDWRPDLIALVGKLSPGRDDAAELDRLFDVVNGCQGWVVMPSEIQRALIGHVAARLRALQERGAKDARIDKSFLMLTAYSARERPGFVIGLNRTHKAVRGTWAEDADAHMERLLTALPDETPVAPNQDVLIASFEKLVREVDLAPEAAKSAVLSQTVRAIRTALESGVPARHPRLVRLAAPLADMLTSREFRQLRRAIRDDVEASADDVEGAEPVVIPADWPWLARTKGRRAVMVGGSPREQNRARLEQTFGFESLEWIPAEHRRNSLVSVRNRVRAGGLDLVIILRSFVGHDADDVILPACRESGVDWVHVEQGYGVVRIRQSIERFLDPA